MEVVRGTTAEPTNASQRGFTMMELMVVVAILGVLTRVALPVFTGDTRKRKALSEVTAVIAELSVREDQYKIEKGAYLVAPTCPATPAPTGQAYASCTIVNGPWDKLHVALREKTLYCTYNVVIGSGVGTNNPSGFSFTSPIGSWYYVLATCDMDNNSTTNATYFASSVDQRIQKQNEGY